MATPAAGKVGGYDHDFVDDPPKSLECPICFLVLREPLLIDCCGHHICRSCVARIQRDGKPCPLCQAPTFSSMLDKGLQRAVNELNIHCPNCESGCEWVGKLGQVGSHYCQFEKVACTHNCGERFYQRFITQHENFECPQRPFNCEYCGQYNGTYNEVTNSHWPVCDCYPIPCPNKCNAGSIPRNEFEKHLNVNCPLQVVKCDFHYTGCEIEIQREDMPAHLTANLQQHLSLLAAFSLKLNVENQALRQELNQQQAIIATVPALKQEVSQLKQQQANTATKLDVHVQTTKEETKQLKMSFSQLESRLTPVPPFSFTLTGFKDLRKASIPWFSPSFYTHPRGYKMCIEVLVNGQDSKGTHISVFCRILRGEYDHELKWPFQGKVYLQLLNQCQESGHRERVIDYAYADADSSVHSSRGYEMNSRVTVGDMKDGWGYSQFIPHKGLRYNAANNTDYLPRNTLHFSVTQVEVSANSF